MKNPKEKALELCQKIGWTGTSEKQTAFYSLDISLSKKIAIIFVDEIIEQFILIAQNKDYWIEVKSEINKLTI